MSSQTRTLVQDQIKRSIKAQAKGALRRQAVERAHLRPTQVTPHSASEAPGHRGDLRYQSILSPIISYELYNPADEPMEFGYGGETYVLPGASDLWVGQDARSGELMEYTRPGVLPVFGRPDRMFGGNSFPIDALTIVQHAVGEDGRSGAVGVNGVRPLFMDERDEEVMLEARTAWVEKRRFDMEAMIRAHESEVALAIQQRRDPQRPAKRVRDAYRWLEENERAGGITDSCPICFDGFPSERDKQIHIVTFHKRHALAGEAREALGMEEDIVEIGTTIEEPNTSMQTKGKKAVAAMKKGAKSLDAASRGEDIPPEDEDEGGDGPDGEDPQRTPPPAPPEQTEP